MKDFFKKQTVAFTLLIAASPLFANSIGLTSVRQGTGWLILAIVLALVSAVLFIAIGSVNSYRLSSASIGAIVVLGIAGIISGFWIFPTIWCGFFGAVLGLFIAASWKTEKVFFHSPIFSILSILGIIYFALELPQNWWLWKYFAFAIVSSAISISFTLFAEYAGSSSSVSLLSVFILCQFIAFWIVGKNASQSVALILLFAFIIADISAFLILFFKTKKDFQRSEQEQMQQQKSDYEKYLEENYKYARQIIDEKLDVPYEKLALEYKSASSSFDSAKHSETTAKKNLERETYNYNREAQEHKIKEFFGMNDTSKVNAATRMLESAKSKTQQLRSEYMKASENLNNFTKNLPPEIVSILKNGNAKEIIEDYEQLKNARDKKAYEENQRRLLQKQKEIEEERKRQNAQLEETQNKAMFSNQITELGNFIPVLQNAVQNDSALNFQLLTDLENRLLKIKEQKSLLTATDKERMKINREKILEMLKQCKNLPKSDEKAIKNLLKELSK